MVGTIGLAVSRARERGAPEAWRVIAIPHAVSAAIGGALLGVIVAFAGAVLARLASGDWTPTLAVVLVVFAILEAIGVPAKYISRARQVPLSWKETFPPPMSAALYAGTLALGFVSTAYSWTFLAVVVGIFLRAGVLAGIFAGMAFGLGRTVPVFATASFSDPERAEKLATRAEVWIERKRPFVRALAALMIVGVAVALFVWARGS